MGSTMKSRDKIKKGLERVGCFLVLVMVVEPIIANVFSISFLPNTFYTSVIANGFEFGMIVLGFMIGSYITGREVKK